MRLTRIVAFVCLALLWLVAVVTFAAAAEWPLEAMNQQIDATNFVVNSGCSGTLIDADNRLILTANHCVADQYEIIERDKVADDGVVTKEKIRRLKDGTVSQLSFQGAESVQTMTYKVRLVGVSRERDLALVKVIAPMPNGRAAPLACAPPVRGEPIIIVGNPMGMLYSSVTAGIVSSLQRTYNLLKLADNEERQPLMQISGGVVGGNSGGAVYNRDGELVGVPVLGHRINEVIAFAVPLEAIKEFLKEQKLEAVYARCVPPTP